MHYINLGLLLVLVGLVIGVYVHTDKKIDKLSDRIDALSDRMDALSDRMDDKYKSLSDRIDALSDRMDQNNKALTDRIDRLYDILVHMGFREREHRDKAANE